MKFRKKPVVINAWQLKKQFLDDTVLYTEIGESGVFNQGTYGIIHTLEGDMRAEMNDWIITGVNKERYPCKPDIFEKTYEPVE